MLCITGCGAHTATIYIPPTPTTETTAKETKTTEGADSSEIPGTESAEEPAAEAPELELGVVYHDDMVRIHFREAYYTQNGYYLAYEVEALTEEEVNVSIFAAAKDSRMLDDSSVSNSSISAVNGSNGLVTANISINEFGDNEPEPSLSFVFDIAVGENEWKSSTVYMNQPVLFDPTKQVAEIYTDNFISVYNNGMTAPGQYTFIVYNKSEECLTFSPENLEDDATGLAYYLADAIPGSGAKLIGGAYEEINISMPAVVEGTPGVMLHITGEGEPDIQVPCYLQ